MERAEYRILGPQYKSPRLVKPEILASTRFRAGLRQIPGATVDEAGKMLDELATGWSQGVGRPGIAFWAGCSAADSIPRFDYDEYQVAAMRAALEAHPAVLLFSHRSYIDGAVVPVAMQDNRLPPVHVFGGINLSFGVMGPLHAARRDDLHPPQHRRQPALQVRAAASTSATSSRSGST